MTVDHSHTATLEGFRLSPQQDHLARLAAELPDWHGAVLARVEVEGELTTAALSTAARRVVERHEILRSTFNRLSGMEAPLQVIHAEAEVAVEGHDLAALGGDEEGRRLDELEADLWSRAGDGEEAPVLHLVLASLGARRHHLLAALPAMAGDRVTLRRVVAELAAELAGEPVAADPIQYADSAEGFLDLLESPDTAEGRRHWQRPELSAAMAQLPGAQEVGRRRRVEASLTSTPALLGLARELDLAPADLVFAAWSWMWARLAAAGTEGPAGPVFNLLPGRDWEGLDTAMGRYARSVPVPLDPSPRHSFRHLAAAAAGALAQAAENQDFFSRRQVSGAAPTAPVHLFESVSPAPEHLAGGRRFRVTAERESAELFLTHLSLVSGPGPEPAPAAEGGERPWRVALAYDPASRDERSAGWLLERLDTLLADAARRPDAPLADLRWIGPSEGGWLDALNRTALDLPLDVPLHVQVAEQAAATPDAPAVRDGDGDLTYGALVRAADGLADRLRRRGVGRGDVVGIAAERSTTLVVGLLGILRAGAAYLPLDPAYPAQRLEMMLEDSGAALLVLEEPAGEAFAATEVPRLALRGGAAEGPLEAPAQGPAEAVAVGGDDLAYVIYTSGSTGRPKGVMMSHRGIVHRLRWMTEAFPTSADDRVLQKTPFSFDASIWEIFVPLLTGGTVVMAEPGGHRDAAYLARAVVEEGITVFQSVPSMLNTFLERPELEGARLRRVFSGGEALPAQIGRLCEERLGVELINLYGPTETAIDATFHRSSATAVEAVVPIGRPLSNARVHLLSRGRRVPVGVPGELHVAGAGLARGYLRRPGLTAERFLPDPFAEAPGDRLYATGDLARLDANGELHFLGRGDDQVKVRGYRIELGEVEAVIQSHPGIAEAAAQAQETAGGARLVAWFSPGEAVAGPSPDELRDFLAARLPEHMVPTLLVPLERLPRTPSGKLDRKALPEPRPDGRSETADVGPQTATQELLAEIWSDLLQVEAIGPDDDFFALGGHSLAATRLVARLAEVFRVELSLRNVFQLPTLAALAERIDEARGSGPAFAPPAIGPRPDAEDAPLSFAQQRLWFIEQVRPGTPVYNLADAVWFDGRLDLGAAVAGLRAVVARHDALRTVFALGGDGPRQRVVPHHPFRVPLVDLSALPEERRQAHTRRLALGEARRVFDLEAGPLYRFTFVRLAADRHACLVTLHHIISDGWSTGLLIHELGELYTAAVEGEPARLAPLQIQYPDFAAWQRDWLRGEVLERYLEHWRQRLDGAPPLLDLPTDRPRPAVQGGRGARLELRLPEATSRAVHRLSRERGATVYMTLLAAYKALLARWSGQTDLSVGSPVAGRNRAETEPLVGMFVNTLVLRTDLSDDPAFGELVDRVRSITLEAHDYQDLPFERLVDEVADGRDLSYSPLFQAAFVFQNMPLGKLRLPGLEVSPWAVDPGTAKFDLTLTFEEDEAGIHGSLEYDLDLFDTATAVRLADHYQRLLTAAVEEPARPLSELPLLAPENRDELLRRLAPAAGPEGDKEVGTEVDTRPAAAGLHRLFEEMARRHAGSTAVSCGDEHYSYAQLDRKANRLANLLRLQGVGPGMRVAILCDRSVAMVTAVLATLKAGGVYVPLDPIHPPERLSYMLRDSAARVLLTDSEPAEGLAVDKLTVVRLDESAATLAQQSDRPPTLEDHPSGAAYVIYTSGSTGRPKGVVVTHANVLRLFTASATWFDFGGDDVWTLFHTYTFDFSVWELWGPLLHGGRLVVVPYWVTRSPDAFRDLLRDEGVTVLNQTPSAFRQLVQSEVEAAGGDGGGDGGGAPASALRWVIFGGEALDVSSLGPWFDLHGDRRPRLVNMYGITETTVHVTYRELSAADLAQPHRSPIGRPLPDLAVYPLDRYLEPTPPGVRGELFVAGPGLARGYLGRPGLTAERFVPDPFSTDEGGRLYRSGDLGRLLPDGSLEYLGRADQQVKVRGFRIEPGEIEAALVAHPGVREAAVLARDEGAGETRLVAYHVAVPETAPSVDELRDHLMGRLPSYMVPAAFVRLDAWPLTANGKLDRNALPAPESARPELESTYLAPRDGVEAALVNAWARVLGVDQVGVDDNFFALGGDSILSIQMVSHLAQEGYRVTPQQVFQHQTVAELAQVVTATSAPQAEQGPVRGEAPLTPIQEWFFAAPPAHPSHWNQAVLLNVPRSLDGGRLAAACRTLAEHHDTLRARFTRAPGGGWKQTLEAPRGDELPLRHFDFTDLDGEAREAAFAGATAAVQAGLDLEGGPLARVAFFDLGAEAGGRLLFVAHHLVVDAVSWRVLLADLAALVGGAVDGGALPPKTTSYFHWARELAAHVEAGGLDDELDHWRSVEAAEVAPLPLDLVPAERNVEASVGTVVRELEADATSALLREVPEHLRVRSEEILLTSLARSLGAWTGQDRLRVHLEGHGREDLFEGADVSRTVGWFTSIYPVLLPAARATDATTTLKAVKESVRRIPRRGAGYGALRYGGRLDAEGGPAAEISFNYMGQIDGGATGDLRIADESPGPPRHPEALRRHLLDVGAVVNDGRLRVEWTYSEAVHHRDTVSGMADRFVAELKALLGAGGEAGEAAYTPADFPEMDLDQGELDDLLAEIGGEG